MSQSLDHRRGRLIVVGTGIHPGQLTLEALSVIKGADRLLYMFNSWVAKLNPVAENLDAYRAVGKHRGMAYEQMVDRILDCLRHGEKVCAAFYGHPGVAVWASHAAIRRARAEGFEARMLPGVSSVDCLFADLGIDPSPIGSK
jgi:precorrin-2 methylase